MLATRIALIAGAGLIAAAAPAQEADDPLAPMDDPQAEADAVPDTNPNVQEEVESLDEDGPPAAETLTETPDADVTDRTGNEPPPTPDELNAAGPEGGDEAVAENIDIPALPGVEVGTVVQNRDGVAIGGVRDIVRSDADGEITALLVSLENGDIAEIPLDRLELEGEVLVADWNAGELG